MATATLHLISGLPCAGKTTYARRLRERSDAVLLSLDHWLITSFGSYPVDVVGHGEHVRRVYASRELIWTVAAEFLRRGAEVILDDGFFLRDDRRQHATWAREIGVESTIHFIDTPTAVLRERLVARNRSREKFQFEISPEALDGYAAIFQPPATDEGAGLVTASGTAASA